MKTRRCSGAVSLFADNAVYFPSRTCARPRNIIVHVFLLLLGMLKKYAA